MWRIVDKAKKLLAVTVKSLLINPRFNIKRCVVVFYACGKLVIINLLCIDWADVKYHVPTVIVFYWVLKIKDFNDCMLNIYGCLLK